ncbi:MAG: DUF3782 domain-containing protein, partial [Candidatus Asgardarchaeia archaeon]
MSVEKTRELLKKELILLLREDPDFRREMYEILSESFVIREEVKAILKELRILREDFNHEMKGLREDFVKKSEEHDKSINRLYEELTRLREDFNKLYAYTEKRFSEFSLRLDALGARWGIFSEEAFRSGLKSILEKYFNAKVERKIINDNKGKVFGEPAIVEMDIVILNEEHIIVEIKSHVGKSDIATLLRMGSLYEELEGVKPKLMIISPYVDDRAMEFALRKNVEVHT